MTKKNKKAVISKNPYKGKSPRITKNPVGFDTTVFQWRVHSKFIDYDHTLYGWCNCQSRHLLEDVICKLHEYEGLTWNEIKHKPHCHSKPIDELDTDLQKRLVERDLDCLEDLFQIAVGSKPRIFGYREKSIYYLIWYDPDHKIDPTTI